jgi:outer membrane lipoprotein-sorting protein
MLRRRGREAVRIPATPDPRPDALTHRSPQRLLHVLPLRSAVLCGLLAGGLLAGSAAAAAARLPDPQDPSLSAGERVAALIERVRLAQKDVDTLQADFVQRQESAMLVEPDVSRGTFSYAAPESVRWEYAAPRPISVVIDGDVMTTWYRDLGRAERLKVGRYSNQVLKYLGATGSFDTLMEYFQVRVRFPEGDDPYRVDLTPRYERVARRLAGMTIWVDAERFLPVRLRYEGADGDVTEYEFTGMKVNAEIPAERFRLDLPAGVEVREVELGRS